MVNLTRRAVLGVTVGTLAASVARRATAQGSDDPFPLLPAAYGADSQRDFLPRPTLGNVPPPQIDRDVARRLMERAPFDCAPVDVALYFRDVGQGKMPDLGSDALQRRAGPHFVRGWPRYYNPVVVGFFQATTLDPTRYDGDGTHWCAAFVNWCIARGRSTSAAVPPQAPARAFGTRSASSGSFRCWPSAGGSTRTPQRGDVVVWAKEGTVSGCSLGTGHVAFFLGNEPDGRILVVGGNQRDPETVVGATQSAVCRKAMPRSFNVARAGQPAVRKTLHSYRTAGFLRA